MAHGEMTAVQNDFEDHGSAVHVFLELGDLARDGNYGPLFVPELAVGLHEAAGDETGAEMPFQPLGLWYFPHVDAQLYGGNPGHHTLACKDGRGKTIGHEQDGKQVMGPVILKGYPTLHYRRISKLALQPPGIPGIQEHVHLIQEGKIRQGRNRYARSAWSNFRRGRIVSFEKTFYLLICKCPQARIRSLPC
jgi:hypothetical protein